jgi:hypothetical protein
MHAERLKSLLAEGGIAPARLPELAEHCDHWFMEDPGVATYVLWRMFDGLRRTWDDEQGVPTAEYSPFKERLLAALFMVAEQLAGNQHLQIAATLDELVKTYRECRIAADKAPR